jgi:hypothetical protein
MIMGQGGIAGLALTSLIPQIISPQDASSTHWSKAALERAHVEAKRPYLSPSPPPCL